MMINMFTRSSNAKRIHEKSPVRHRTAIGHTEVTNFCDALAEDVTAHNELITLKGDRLMMILNWNIRSGGGTRVPAIADAIKAHRPDIVVLTEFRNGPKGASLLSKLTEQGTRHFCLKHHCKPKYLSIIV